jgi:hypothetical protein
MSPSSAQLLLGMLAMGVRASSYGYGSTLGLAAQKTRRVLQ